MFFRVAIFTLAALLGIASASTVLVVNGCNQPIDPAFFPAADGGSTGGFVLQQGQSRSVTLPPGYSGRAWARTGCDAQGNCRTGTCPGGIDCTGPSPAGPTLAQFTIDGFQDLDFFNPSVVDGFNVVVTLAPNGGCTVGAVSCTDAAGDGNDCNDTSACPTGITYTLTFSGCPAL